MNECGILEKIFPFYSEIKKIPNNSHHHLDLFNHLVESVNQIERIVNSQSQEIIDYFNEDFGVSP